MKVCKGDAGPDTGISAIQGEAERAGFVLAGEEKAWGRINLCV